MRMDVLYFIGYDLDEELPWHSTLSRTRKLYGQEEFVAIFKQVLKLCINKGLISGKRQAVDSVLVKANASIGMSPSVFQIIILRLNIASLFAIMDKNTMND